MPSASRSSGDTGSRKACCSRRRPDSAGRRTSTITAILPSKSCRSAAPTARPRAAIRRAARRCSSAGRAPPPTKSRARGRSCRRSPRARTAVRWRTTRCGRCFPSTRRDEASRISTRASSAGSSASSRRRASSSAWSARRRRRRPAPSTAWAISISRRASRSSSGAACPTTSCATRPRAARCAIQRGSSGRWRACSAIRDRARSSRISRAAGSS